MRKIKELADKFINFLTGCKSTYGNIFTILILIAGIYIVLNYAAEKYQPKYEPKIVVEPTIIDSTRTVINNTNVDIDLLKKELSEEFRTAIIKLNQDKNEKFFFIDTSGINVQFVILSNNVSRFDEEYYNSRLEQH